MTTIVAYQGQGFAVVGCDSRISSFDENGQVLQMSTLGFGSSKVSEVGRYLVGVAGDARAINIVQHAFEPPQLPVDLFGKRLAAFITRSFVASLKETLEEHGYATTPKDQQKSAAEQNSTVLVAANGTVFVIETDYGWASDRLGFYAIGTGSAYALGAMTALVGEKELSVTQAKTVVTKALNVAAGFDPSTGGPFRIFVQQKDS